MKQIQVTVTSLFDFLELASFWLVACSVQGSPVRYWLLVAVQCFDFMNFIVE